MKILAFLQNMWVHAHQVLGVSRCHPISNAREDMIRYALFAGCLTGRRLKQAFGKTLCDCIIWQEASPVVSSNSRDYHSPNEAHIRAVLDKHTPDLVLIMTMRGADQIERIIHDCRGDMFPIVKCPHPAARAQDTTARLAEARASIDLAVALKAKESANPKAPGFVTGNYDGACER